MKGKVSQTPLFPLSVYISLSHHGSSTKRGSHQGGEETEVNFLRFHSDRYNTCLVCSLLVLPGRRTVPETWDVGVEERETRRVDIPELDPRTSQWYGGNVEGVTT